MSARTHSPSKTGASAAQKARKAGRLETTAKSVRQSGVGRADRFRWQRHAAKLLGGVGRVGLCRYSVVSKTAGVDLVSSRYGDGPASAHYEGLQTCGSVWACPCCGARISQTRRDELNQLLSWARSQGHHVSMVTLTARHGRDDDLEDLLSKMKDAKGRWARHRSYRVLKTMVVGSVTATEVTGGGAHGWHPHFHVIFITSGEVDFSPLRDAWLASLRGAGLDGTGSGWDVRDAGEVGTYLGKWGAAEELALKDRKKGRSGRTPAQLLAASCDEGDKTAGRLWAEYARVFHGRRQLVWSRGLKALAGIGEVDDAEAAKDEQQEEQEETGRANIDHRTWVDRIAVPGSDRRSEILERAEDVGPQLAAIEIKVGHDAEAVIEDQDAEPDWDFVMGELAAAALAAVRPPPGQGP